MVGVCHVAPALDLTLLPTERPGRYKLVCGGADYPIEFRPEIDVIMVICCASRIGSGGARRPGESAEALGLLSAVGSRLWSTLIPAEAPPTVRSAVADRLRNTGSPLLPVLPRL